DPGVQPGSLGGAALGRTVTPPHLRRRAVDGAAAATTRGSSAPAHAHRTGSPSTREPGVARVGPELRPHTCRGPRGPHPGMGDASATKPTGQEVASGGEAGAGWEAEGEEDAPLATAASKRDRSPGWPSRAQW